LKVYSGIVRVRRTGKIGVGIAYLIVLTFSTFVARDITAQYEASTATIHTVIQQSGFGDPASMAAAALEIARTGNVAAERAGVLNVWPPGFIFLQAFILRIASEQVPILWILQLIAMLLFFLVLMQMHQLFSDHISAGYAAILPLGLCAFSVSRLFLLQPSGVVWGETFAIGFFLLGVIYALRSITADRIGMIAKSGASLGLAAYFRPQFEIFLTALTILFLIYLVIQMMLRKPATTRIVKTCALVLLVAQLIMLPWRVRNLSTHASLKWVQTDNNSFQNLVQPDSALVNTPSGFIAEGRGNLACIIDTSVCKRFEDAKSLSIKVLLKNPVKWYLRKYEVVGNFWFAPLGNWANVSIKPETIDYVTNSILLAFFITSLTLLFRRQFFDPSIWLVLFGFNFAIYASYWVIFTIQQFEARYFFFPKIFMIFNFLLVLSLYLSKSKMKQDAPI